MDSIQSQIKFKEFRKKSLLNISILRYKKAFKKKETLCTFELFETNLQISDKYELEGMVLVMEKWNLNILS